MKNVLRSIYVDDKGRLHEGADNIDALQSDCHIFAAGSHLHLEKKLEDRLIVKWSRYSNQSEEVFKNGEQAFLFCQSMDLDENGHVCGRVESVGLCWREEE